MTVGEVDFLKWSKCPVRLHLVMLGPCRSLGLSRRHAVLWPRHWEHSKGACVYQVKAALQSIKGWWQTAVPEDDHGKEDKVHSKERESEPEKQP